MRYSPAVDRVLGRGANVWAINWKAKELIEAGRKILFLSVGSPDQAPPAPVLDATIAALRAHHTHYSNSLGEDDTRAAIAARVVRRSGRPCIADNVAVVPGAQAGLFFTMQCLLGAGDEVVVPEPMYATYEAVVGATGARIVAVPLVSERGFHPDIDAIANAITERTRVLWINSPHNPTGAVLERAELEALAGLCRRHDLWLVSDEVYEDIVYTGMHASAWSLPDMAERTVVVSSLSKSHAIPGFRMGWVVGPTDFVEHVFHFLLCATYGSPVFIQEGALAGLTADLPEVAALREDYRRRALLLVDVLGHAPRCRVVRPAGGMFVLLDIRPLGVSAWDFALRVLEHHGIAILPCDGFGASGVGHVRISLTVGDDQLRSAGEKIVSVARELAVR